MRWRERACGGMSRQKGKFILQRVNLKLTLHRLSYFLFCGLCFLAALPPYLRYPITRRLLGILDLDPLSEDGMGPPVGRGIHWRLQLED